MNVEGRPEGVTKTLGKPGGGGVACLKDGVLRARVNGRNRGAVLGFFRRRKAMTPIGSGSI
jgi:hypothetical protein